MRVSVCFTLNVYPRGIYSMIAVHVGGGCDIKTWAPDELKEAIQYTKDFVRNNKLRFSYISVFFPPEMHKSGFHIQDNTRLLQN